MPLEALWDTHPHPGEDKYYENIPYLANYGSNNFRSIRNCGDAYQVCRLLTDFRDRA